MGFTCGIIGLPNIGKSTIFNALTSAGAEASNYPFCTIEPNTGVVAVPDNRLNDIAKAVNPKSVIPTTIQFVDIAGLVKGASKGEGLGNQFLSHIRNVDAIAHVVRCFNSGDVVHVDGSVDPLRDIEVIKTELILADLETIEKRIEKNLKLMKGLDKKAAKQNEILDKLKAKLNEGVLAKFSGLSQDELNSIKDLFLLTTKPFMYVCNIDEAIVGSESEHVKAVKEYAQKEGAKVICLCGQIEAEVAELSEEDKESFLEDYGLTESGLSLLIRAGYELLGLITFFTTRSNELKAWTVKINTRAPKAAGVIHTDFEKGFIKAEVYHYDDLMDKGTPGFVKDAGLCRIEGKDYVVVDGDVILFRFNV